VPRPRRRSSARRRRRSKIEKAFQKGVITEGERYLKIVDLWTHARELVGDDLMKVLHDDFSDDSGYVNPLYCMVSSGARGSIDQIRQLGGMRGLMAKPSGKIIETPIKATSAKASRSGVLLVDARRSKGLADTALKTADAGYLTRKLTDVAQNVVITLEDCGTLNGVTKSVVYKGREGRGHAGAGDPRARRARHDHATSSTTR
jgi:DNA-directed RNA polymerase subunit beta'